MPEELFKRQEKLPRASSRSHGKDWFTLDFVRSADGVKIIILFVRCTVTEILSDVSRYNYHPPENLTPGQVIHENWAFCRSQYVGWGDFSIFVQHNPSPLEKLRRKLYV